MIYFIQNTETKDIKIGYTVKDPEKRLKQLQTGSSSPLALLYILSGTQQLEKQIHKVLRIDQIQGEWFRPSIRMWILLTYHLMMAGDFQGHDFLHYHAKRLGLPERVYFHILEANDQEEGLRMIRFYD